MASKERCGFGLADRNVFVAYEPSPHLIVCANGVTRAGAGCARKSSRGIKGWGPQATGCGASLLGEGAGAGVQPHGPVQPMEPVAVVRPQWQLHTLKLRGLPCLPVPSAVVTPCDRGVTPSRTPRRKEDRSSAFGCRPDSTICISPFCCYHFHALPIITTGMMELP